MVSLCLVGVVVNITFAAYTKNNNTQRWQKRNEQKSDCFNVVLKLLHICQESFVSLTILFSILYT